MSDLLLPSLIGLAADQVADNADRLGLKWGLRPATVIESILTTGSIKTQAQLDGDTTAMPVFSLVGLVFAGERVMTINVPPQGIYIVGFYGPRVWQSYTVVWTSTSGTPSVGDGTLRGRFKTDGRAVTAEVGLAWGSTTAAAGRWFYSLPFVATTDSINTAAGALYMFDSGVANRTGVCAITSGGDALFLTASPNGDVGAGTPQTWSNGDAFRASITYEMA